MKEKKEYLTHPGRNLQDVMKDVFAQHSEESFYFLNERRLKETAEVFQKHFLPEDFRRRIAYVLKDNPHSEVLRILTEVGKIVLIRSEETDEIKGMTFGSYDSLESIIEKEWGHPYNYMKKEYQKKEQEFDVKKSLEKIKTTEESIKAQTEVYCWNYIILSREVLGNVNLLVRNFLQFLLRTDIPVVAQVLSGSITNTLLKRRGYREIQGVFSREYQFMSGDLDEVRQYYLKNMK